MSFSSLPSPSVDLITKHFMPLLVSCVTDDVPNVRIYTSITLACVAKHLDAKVVTSKIKPLLTQMKKDPDVDVVHAAAKALRAL